MTITGSEDVAEMLYVLLEAENVAEMSDGDASSGNGVYVTDVGVQTDGPNECCALAASELLVLDCWQRVKCLKRFCRCTLTIFKTLKCFIFLFFVCWLLNNYSSLCLTNLHYSQQSALILQ